MTLLDISCTQCGSNQIHCKDKETEKLIWITYTNCTRIENITYEVTITGISSDHPLAQYREAVSHKDLEQTISKHFTDIESRFCGCEDMPLNEERKE